MGLQVPPDAPPWPLRAQPGLLEEPSPARGAVNVPVETKTITVTFNETMAPVPSSGTLFTLEGPGGNLAPAATVAYDSTGRQAILTLGTDLPAFTLCTATLTTAAKDLAGNPLAAPFVWTFTTGANLGQMTVLAGSTITNTGPTIVTGNMGVNPGTSVNGFPPGIQSGGVALYLGDAVSGQAQADLATAYDHYQALGSDTDLTGQDLGGLTLTPGVYRFGTESTLTGNLTLDGSGDPGAIFVFQIGTRFTMASGSAVGLINQAQPGNVFWLVGSSATLGNGSTFTGNLMARTAVTLMTGTSITGRVLVENGAVTLDTNVIGPSVP